jgi:hypothetical protein
MKIAEIIDENFQMIYTFSPNYENIIDLSQPGVVGEELWRGGVVFEFTKE